MAISKRIVITSESREVFIIRRSSSCGFTSYCPSCGFETEILTLDQAVSYALEDTREMIRRIDDQRVHSLETADGHLLVCRNSLETP